MARRDYKNAPRSGERSSGRRSGPWKLLLGGILLGLVVAAVMAWYLIPRAGDFKRVESAPKTRIPPTSIATPAPGEPADPGQVKSTETPPDASNYTFYDILPGNQAAKPQPATPNREQWWLQVAALKSAADADSLRARLTLLNLHAVVQPTVGAGAPLHRVRVGPFKDQDAAESVQQTLLVNNFEARLLKEAVHP